jgi:hypothetical protein
MPSQADFLDNSMVQQNLFPPAASVQSGSVMESINNYLPSKPPVAKQSSDNYGFMNDILPANSLISGSSFF